MGNIFIDVGSSTVKAYQIVNKEASLLVQRSIHFKDGFDPGVGIAEAGRKDLFEFIDAVQDENKGAKVKIYATGIFRKMTHNARVLFVDKFFERTGLFFNIISQDIENFYLEMALTGRCPVNSPVMLINIGGGSTELVIMYGREAVEKKNIDIGVASVIAEFPGINDTKSDVSISNVVEFIKSNLPDISNEVSVAFYNGGELNYMRLSGYALKKNTLFDDNEHPMIISAEDFSKRNEEIFEEITIKDLEVLMPHDPKWMHGARGCSAIAQAICQKYGIHTIVPSDSNTVDGIARQEFRYVALSGSFRKHLEYILKIKDQLEMRGTKVLSPRFTKPKNPGEEFVVFDGEEGRSSLELERYHLDAIAQSDALIVCDPGGYVGASALIGIGLANAIGKRIIFTEKPEEFMLNTLPAEVGL